MAVPIVSNGTDDATTENTELIYDPSELKLSTPVAESLPGVYLYLTFNYVHGPTFEVSVNAERYDVGKLYALHNRWDIDIRSYTSSLIDSNSNNLCSAKPNGPHTNDVQYWCRSAGL